MGRIYVQLHNHAGKKKSIFPILDKGLLLERENERVGLRMCFGKLD